MDQGQVQNLEFRNFHEILTLVAAHVPKNKQIRSLTRISMPRGADVAISIQMGLRFCQC